MRRVCSADSFWSLVFSHHVSVEQVPNKECYFITTQKMKFPIKYFFSKCDQIRRKLGICCRCCCCCFAFHQLFFWWSFKFPQLNVNKSETRIGDKKLSVELYILWRVKMSCQIQWTFDIVYSDMRLKVF